MNATIIYAALGGKGNVNSIWAIEGDVKENILPVTPERIEQIKKRYSKKQ